MVKALQELLLPDWNNAFIVVTIGPKGVLIPKVREKNNWLVHHPHFRTEHRVPGVLMYDGPMTVKSLLRTEVKLRLKSWSTDPITNYVFCFV